MASPDDNRMKHSNTTPPKNNLSPYFLRQKSVQHWMSTVRGKRQRRGCRDFLFSLLFYAQLLSVSYIGATYGSFSFTLDPWNDEYKKSKIHNIKVEYWNMLQTACACGVFALVLSGLALIFMMVFSRNLIQIALVFSIVLSTAWSIIGIVYLPTSFFPVTGIIVLLLCIGYTLVVYDRIPFAAANVHTGLCGVRANWGTVFVAYFFQVVAFAWSLWWFFSFVGIYDWMEECVERENSRALVYVMLGVSYYWTFQVIQHVVQVTVAGAIGKWWSNPSTHYDTHPVVWNSFVNSTIFTFGSICFGSLFVGFVQTARVIIESFRPQHSDNILLCLQQFILSVRGYLKSLIDHLVHHFNPWAFTYVGLYGYNFLDAGHNATLLFKERGWTKISSDDLITNVLLMFSFVIAGCTGFFGYFLEMKEGYGFTSFHFPESTAFLTGFLLGFVLSCILLGIVSSSANAVIVCFAGSPQEFEENHPKLNEEMRAAWKEVWRPDYMDIKMSFASLV